MIAVTSLKLNAIPEVLRNQDAAACSWQAAFDEVAYTNNVRGFDDPPTIVSLAAYCSSLKDWSCIINADIVVHPQAGWVWKAFKEHGASCAISRRYEFYPDQPDRPPQLKDLGLDIFCAIPEVWTSIARNIPTELLLGHIMWDTWVLAWMNSHYRDSLYDFTPCKAIFHPKHGGRGDQEMNRELASLDARKMGMPRNKLALPLPEWHPARILVV